MLKELKYVLKAENNISRLVAILIIYAIIWSIFGSIAYFISGSVLIAIGVATPICIFSLWRELRNPLFTEHGVHAYVVAHVMYPEKFSVHECGSGYKCYYSTEAYSFNQTVNDVHDVNKLINDIVEMEWSLYH